MGWLYGARGIVGLRVCNVFVMTFPRGMVLFIARVDESLVSDKEIASGKCLCTDVANERLLFRVSADVSLEVFLQAVLATVNGWGRVATAEGGRARGREGLQAWQRVAGNEDMEESWFYCQIVFS